MGRSVAAWGCCREAARVADTAATQQLVLVLGAYVLYRFHGLQFPAVVTAIDAIQKSVTVVVMVLKAGADNPSRSQGLPTFKEAVVSKGDVRATLAPSPSLTDDVSATATARLREFAICKECRGIFHVCPTSLSAPNEDSQAALHGEESKLEALLKRRQELLLAKQYDQVLLCTEEIKAQKRVVQVARRGQEHLSQLSCPLCGVVT